jgi:hypothetical protein
MATPRVCATVKAAAAPSSAYPRSTCAAAPNVRSPRHSAPTRTVCKSRNSFADVLFKQGLMALMQPIICCVKAQSAREFVTEFSGGVTPRTEAVWLRATVEL